MLPDITIRQLEYLVAAAYAQSWSAAAAHVGVSGSALSQGLSELERRLGVPLFESHGRRRVLRASAAPVLDHARRVLTQTRELVGWTDDLRRGRRGSVRVGMIDVAAVSHYPDLLASFRTRHPDVDLTLSVQPSGALLQRMSEGDLDLVVCVDPPLRPEETEIIELTREQLVVVAPPGTAVADPATWGPWVTFPHGSHTRLLVLAALTRLSASRSIVAESHQPNVLIQMVRLGLGWSVLPANPDTDLSGIAIGPTVVERVLVLATRTGALRDPAADDLCKLLTADRRSRPRQ